MSGCSMLAALIILSTMSLIEPAEVPQQISFAVVEVGGNFTLRCPVMNKSGFIYWHKQSLGNMVQTVATGFYNQLSLHGEFNNKRFHITKDDSQFVLTIRNVTKEDEATYICQIGSTYTLTFTYGIFLAVKDPNEQKCVYVKQRPKTESVVPGNSVNLQCSLHSKTEENKVQCPDEHSVYWFRAGESSLSLVYTQNNRINEEEETSCVYSLSRTIQDSSDAGTYYCAVVTCGRILFGDGTNVETRLDPVVLGLLLVLLACSVTLIALLIVCVKRRRFCEHCKEAINASPHPGHSKPAVDQSTNLGGDAETANYVALDFSAKTMKKGKRRRETPEECVYSAVRVEN